MVPFLRLEPFHAINHTWHELDQILPRHITRPCLSPQVIEARQQDGGVWLVFQRHHVCSWRTHMSWFVEEKKEKARLSSCGQYTMNQSLSWKSLKFNRLRKSCYGRCWESALCAELVDSNDSETRALFRTGWGGAIFKELRFTSCSVCRVHSSQKIISKREHPKLPDRHTSAPLCSVPMNAGEQWWSSHGPRKDARRATCCKKTRIFWPPEHGQLTAVSCVYFFEQCTLEKLAALRPDWWMRFPQTTGRWWSRVSGKRES